MNEEHDKPQEPGDLRKRAEAMLDDDAGDLGGLSPEEVRESLEELRTHRIELELQNEDLLCAQEELIASRDRYSDLYDFSPVGYVTVSGEGMIVEANLTIATMLGLERRALIRKPLSAFVVEEDQDTYYTHRRELLDTRLRRICELRLRKGGYSLFWAQLEGIAVDGPGDSGDQLRLAVIDITERKQNEEVIRDRTARIEAQSVRLAEISRMKSEFIATMNHELRTPLNSILALSQLMMSGGTGKDPEKDTEFLTVIERNGRQLLNLINDILNLSSIEAGQVKMVHAEFELRTVLEGALEIIRPLAEAKQLSIEARVADIPAMHSDSERVGQILLNLLSNAVKFTEAGQITVVVSESDGVVSFEVADTGIGINPDVLPHVFDSFRQADGSSTRKYEGTGLGLAIAQKLAGLLGGQITVRSKVGEGSTFTLRLPVRMADGVQAEGDQSPPEAGRTVDVNGATDADPVRPAADRESETATGDILLVVEDNADNLLATTVILEHLGYQCITAVNGELALAAARTHAPALILMDIQLPEMDGLEATRRIKADAVLEDIPIVALTTRAMKGDREKILTAGCDDYMSKPIDPVELGRILRKWLGEAVPAGKHPMKCQ